jgi:hypothetical protein
LFRWPSGDIRVSYLHRDENSNLFTVPVAKGATTRVKLSGSGFRFAGDASRITVTIGGMRVAGVSFGRRRTMV